MIASILDDKPRPCRFCGELTHEFYVVTQGNRRISGRAHQACSMKVKNESALIDEVSSGERLSSYEDQSIELPLGYMMEQCDDWDAMCEEIGINPWILSEGIANHEDRHPVTIGQAKRHGII